MTIVASVNVRDGLVIATDSMTQISAPGGPGEPPQWVKAYSNARKLFQIGYLPMGVATYGLGNLGSRSVERLVLDFIDEQLEEDDDPTVAEVADGLHAYVRTEYDAIMDGVDEDERPEMGLLVAGHSSDEPFAHGKELLLPRDDAPTDFFEPAAAGAQWRGVNSPFIRLWKGFDPGLLVELSERGVDQQLLLDAAEKVEAYAVYDGMPVQDAIDFAVFILTTTIGYTTVAFCPPFGRGLPPGQNLPGQHLPLGQRCSSWSRPAPCRLL